MQWWLARTVIAVAAMWVGALLGWLVGQGLGWPKLGALGGGALGIGAVALVDSLRAWRLLRWLRSADGGTAPRDPGVWGEVGYRLERALLARQRTIVQERQRLEQFLSAIEASPNGVLLLDASDQIDWMNAMAAQHFALDPQRDRRQRVTNLVRAPAFVAAMQSGLVDAPVVFHGPDGRSTLSVLVRPYGDRMRLVLSQDITERERADAMRRDFVANVSHEIRTPLTVLAGFVETMAGLPLSEAERRRVLVLMAQQTDRMQALVADLLTLAQLEGSPRPTADRWHPVAALMQRVLADGRALSGGRHQFTASGGEAAEIAGDLNELLSAAGNLVNNAVRYTPEGGRIGVHWRLGEDGSGVLEVADTGPGIAREHLSRLTERFYRVDGSRSRDTGGTGLGLSIVKHVAQRHGGEIEIASELGKGSCFRLLFPALRVRALAPQPATSATEALSA